MTGNRFNYQTNETKVCLPMLLQRHSLLQRLEHSSRESMTSLWRFFHSQSVSSCSILGGTGRGVLLGVVRPTGTAILFAVLIGLGTITLPNTVNASIFPYYESFDNYVTGSINNQGEWHSIPTEMQVVNSQYYNSPYSLSNSGADSIATTTLDTFDPVASNDFILSIAYYSNDSTGTGSANNGEFSLYDISSDDFTPGGVAGSSARVCGAIRYGNSDWRLYTGDGDNVSFGTVIIDSWNNIDIEFSPENNTCRARLNNGSWSTTISPANTGTGAFTAYAKGLLLKHTGAIDNGYWDSIYGNLSENITQSNYSYIGFLQPQNGSTTATTNVNIGLLYSVGGTPNYTRHVFDIKDLSIKQQLLPITGSITSSGTISRSTTLTTGHLYSIIGRICTYNYEQCLSTNPNTFSVVSTTTYSYGTDPTILSSIATTTNWAQGGLSATTSIGTNFSTSTAQGILGKLRAILPEELYQKLSTKFPFSYVFDGALMFDELGGYNASSTNISMDFPVAQASTSELTIINTESLENSTTTQAIRGFISNAMYLVVGIYLMASIMSAI